MPVLIDDGLGNGSRASVQEDIEKGAARSRALSQQRYVCAEAVHVCNLPF